MVSEDPRGFRRLPHLPETRVCTPILVLEHPVKTPGVLSQVADASGDLGPAVSESSHLRETIEVFTAFSQQ
jgi:hypothetical protein